MEQNDDSTEQAVIHKSELINVPIFVISVQCLSSCRQANV